MTITHAKISNRDFIAGQPALNVREMFLSHEDTFDVDVIRTWLLLDRPTAVATIEELVELGYLETLNHPSNAPQLTRTALAIALTKSGPDLPLTQAGASKIVLALLQKIRLVNASPLAHRIDSIKIYGSLLSNPLDNPLCVQAEIYVAAVCTSNPNIQANLERLAALFAEQHDTVLSSFEERQNYSQQSIRYRLLSIHDQLSLRFRMFDRISRKRRIAARRSRFPSNE